jgi:hypothetical protein
MPIAVSRVDRSSPAQAGARGAVEAPGLPAPIWPIEYWLRLQADLFRLGEPAVIGWMGRRCAAASAAVEGLGRLAACTDLAAAVAIQADWIEGARERLVQDIEALGEQAQMLSQYAAGAAGRVVRTTSEVTAPAAGWLVRRAAGTAPPPSGGTESYAMPADEALWQCR